MQSRRRIAAAVIALSLALVGCESPDGGASDSDYDGPGIGIRYDGKPGWQFDDNIPIVIPFDGSTPGYGFGF